MMEKRNKLPSKKVQRIITAAGDAFAEKGFNGTTVDAIAQKAGVNKATLYYHIGDKQTLYTEVVRTVLESNIDLLQQNIRTARSPEAQLRRYIRTLAAGVNNDPWLPKIMLRELASGGTSLPDVVLQSFARLLDILKTILDEGEKKGAFVAAVPLLIHMMILGTLMFYKTSTPIRERAPQLTEKTLRGHEMVPAGEISEEVEELVIRAIRR